MISTATKAVTEPGQAPQYFVNLVMEFGSTGILTMAGYVTTSSGEQRMLADFKIAITGGTGRFLGATGNLLVPDAATSSRIANVWVPKL